MKTRAQKHDRCINRPGGGGAQQRANCYCLSLLAIFFFFTFHGAVSLTKILWWHEDIQNNAKWKFIFGTIFTAFRDEMNSFCTPETPFYMWTTNYCKLSRGHWRCWCVAKTAAWTSAGIYRRKKKAQKCQQIKSLYTVLSLLNGLLPRASLCILCSKQHHTNPSLP